MKLRIRRITQVTNTQRILTINLETAIFSLKISQCIAISFYRSSNKRHVYTSFIFIS